MSLATMSTVLPYAAHNRVHHYRTAFFAVMAIAVFAGALGYAGAAIAAAAVGMTIVLVVYLYDVNQWREEPTTVVGAVLVLAVLLGAAFTVVWRDVLFERVKALDLHVGPGPVRPDLESFLVVCVLVPLVSTALMQIGPVYLSSRSRFDDLIDGFTFGVVTGSAFAAAETIASTWSLFSAGTAHLGGSGALWVALVVNAGVVKPFLYGSAAGIAAAEFSGLGSGHRGFSARYGRGLLEAAAALVTYQTGLYLFGLISGDGGAWLGLASGAVIAAVMLLRARSVLHTALLEEALVAPRGPSADLTSHCAHCGMPLIEDPRFCAECGHLTRAVARAVATRVRSSGVTA